MRIGSGVDTAIYNAAGREELFAARERIGSIERGEAAISPAFNLDAKYVIHAVGTWLINKGFAIVDPPNLHMISKVAITKFTEIEGEPIGGFVTHNGRRYDRKFYYGLYTDKEEFLLPTEYDELYQIDDEYYVCKKNGIHSFWRLEV